MKYKRLILLLLIFSIILNFGISSTSYAIDPFSLTLGGMAISYAVAEAIYLFTLASAAVGVTYATWQEAKKVYDMYEGTSPAPLDFPDWQPKTEEVKGKLDETIRDKWFSQWELEVLPGGLPPGDPDPQKNKRGILGLLGAIGVMGGFINNYLSMFKSLNPVSGDNILDIGLDGQIVDIGFTDSHIVNSSDSKVYANYNFGGHIVKLYTNGYTYAGLTAFWIEVDGVVEVQKLNSNGKVYNVSVQDRGNFYVLVVDSTSIVHIIPSDYILPVPNDTINYMVDSDSQMFNNNKDVKIPQPNLTPIRRLRKEIDKNGNSYLVWDDTAERLIEEVVLNTPIDEILNPEPYPYTIEPRPEGGVIIRPVIDPTTPYPNPFPQPRPLPTPIYPPVTPEEPNPLPYPLPVDYPDPYPWLPPHIPRPDPIVYPNPSPYPPYDPSPVPNPNPSPVIPVDPGKQIDYTPWLQIIINWLSRIWNKIPEEKEQDQEVDPEVSGIDFSPLQSIDLKNKFPFSLPWDIKASIELLVDDPEAPRWEVPIVSETIVIDLDQFEQLALISRSFLSIIYIVILVILTRRFIGGS